MLTNAKRNFILILMKKTELLHLIVCVIVLLVLSMFPLPKRTDILAEQSGSSPESGTDSYIKTGYDWLVAKGTNYGSADAADWTNNWGTYWNRIMEAAAWEPGGDLETADVFSGKTFYGGNNDRDVQTGTLDMSLMKYDNYKDGDSEAEESSWTNSCPVASGNCSEDVYKDNRTGLYWSSSQGVADNNNFTISTCAFFSTEPRGDYDGTDADCGDDPDPYNQNAINICGLLAIDADDDGVNETDWYLPSQGELMMAYLDGIYNQTSAAFATTSYFWSSTESSDGSSYAWLVHLHYGYTTYATKTNDTVYVRCVRGD